jgi:hypothetical protein
MSVAGLSVQITCRSFLGGVGAAIIASCIPLTALTETVREMPRIVLTVPSQSAFTASYLAACVSDIGRQVEKIALLRPNLAEKQEVQWNIDDVLDQIRPIATLIEIKAPWDRIAAGEFAFRENRLGVIEIV